MISWNEIRDNAIKFFNEWPDETREASEEQKDLPLFEGRRLHTTELKLEDFHKNVHLFAFIYDPLTMPPLLQKAHQGLDKAIEKCYRPEPLTSDRQRVEYLFQRYEALTAPLLPTTKKRGRK